MQHKKTLFILGKVPPPFYGTSVSMQILIQSKSLNFLYNLKPIDTSVHKDLSSLGTFSLKKIIKNILIYYKFFIETRKVKDASVIIPISQTTIGFLKDAVFIWIANFYKHQVIIHLHGSALLNWYEKLNPTILLFVNKTFSKCSKAIVLGKNLNYLFANFFKDDEIYVVPNGADYHFSIEERNYSTINALYVGNLQSTKGIEDIIEALTILKVNFNLVIHLNVVGAWRNADTEIYCKNLILENNLSVNFLGVLTGNEKLKVYEQANLFLFVPRAPEGHPWVIVEAMAASLPIISTSQGAITESVLHNKNGIIINSSSPNELAKHLLNFNKDLSILKTMGIESRKHYLANFTEQKMIDNLINCINKI